MSFRFLVRRSLCKRSITFISTQCGLDWWGVQSIIAGRAPESGSAFQTMMSLYRLILIGSNGGGHSPAKFGRVLRKVRDCQRPSAHQAAKPQIYRPTSRMSFTKVFLPLLSVSTRVSRSRANSPGKFFVRFFGKRTGSDLTIVRFSTIDGSLRKSK